MSRSADRSIDGSANESVVDHETIRDAIRPVLDPELDESIVDLGYIDEIDITANEASEVAVTVRFTLPTAWCSPAFAWMMADGAKEAAESVSGVTHAEIELRDHMHETEINTGINEGRSFAESFPDADGGLESVRATLDHKARLARQHDAIEALTEAGLSPTQLVALSESDLDRTADGGQYHILLGEGSFGVTVDAEPIDEYLQMAAEDGCLDGPEEPMFRTPEGDIIPEEMFDMVQHRARSAKVNLNGQGTVCEALNESRRAALGRSDD